MIKDIKDIKRLKIFLASVWNRVLSQCYENLNSARNVALSKKGLEQFQYKLAQITGKY